MTLLVSPDFRNLKLEIFAFKIKMNTLTRY